MTIKFEFDVNGNQYRSHKIDAMTQYNISRRVAPVLESLKSISGKEIDIKNFAQSIEVLSPLATALSKMSDEESEYIIKNVLQRCERQVNIAWAPVWVKGADRSSFDDMEMPEMIMIVIKVLMDSFSSFLPKTPSISKDQVGA